MAPGNDGSCTFSAGFLGGKLHYNGLSGAKDCAQEQPGTVKREAPTESKPFVDAASFQQFLSAAYVVQQHNDQLVEKAGTSRVLAAVVEVEEQIRNQGLNLKAAAQVMAQRAQDISNADGATVGIIEKDRLVYYAAAGNALAEAGAQTPLAASLSSECLQAGKLMQCSDAEKDPRLPSGFCREHGIKALIAAPATLQGKVIGVVELRFARSQDFEEEALRGCQLLADLLAETKARTNGAAPPAPQAERESMQDILARIKPELARLAGEDTGEESSPASGRATAAAEPDICRGCGHPMAREEQFCGLCGTQRAGRRPLQSTWASLWDMQQKAEKDGTLLTRDAESLDLLPSELERLVQELASAAPQKTKSRPKPKPETVLPSLSALTAPLEKEEYKEQEKEEPPPAEENRTAQAETAALPEETAGAEPEPESSAQSTPAFAYWTPQPRPGADLRFPFASGRMTDALPEAAAPAQPESTPHEAAGNILHGEAAVQPASRAAGEWTSATKTRAWLDSLQARHSGLGWAVRQWRAQRANIYLGASMLVLLAVLLGWGSPDSPAPVRRAAPQAPQLSFFDRVLVDLGLAEAPPAPVYQGNPNTRVWVDTHTALYYCPGSEQYGKTEGGKFVSQREAQMDAFEPSSRKPCD